MTDHLTDDVLMDVLEGSGGEGAREHLASCAACAERMAQAREGLSLLDDADVPEPSLLYWESFRRQVGRRLESPAVRLARPAFLAPLLAAAAAAVAVALWAPSSPTPSSPMAAPVLPAWSALPPAEEDEGLAVLGAVVPAAGDVALASSCLDAAACLMAELTDEESAALADALRREIPAAREM